MNPFSAQALQVLDKTGNLQIWFRLKAVVPNLTFITLISLKEKVPILIFILSLKDVILQGFAFRSDCQDSFQSSLLC